MNLYSNVLVLHLGANYKTGAVAKPVNELHHPMLSEFSPLPRGSDALQKLRGLLRGDGWPYERLRLALQDDDCRLPDVQPQTIRSI
ncbi:MAG: hypothetical protein V9H26_12310 [Verrucomicrobiota bacterium]|nr:hypothetical protein [Limisphaerales bacterium]